MSEKWPIVRLGEVLRRSDEVATTDPLMEYKEITVRLWGKGVVERGRVLGSEVNGQRYLARQGQFIASRIDARNGAMGIVPESLDGSLVTNDFPLFNVSADRLHVQFLGWLCRTRGFVDLCQRASEGTTNRVRLKEDRFVGLEIPLPPLAEQWRIVGRIEELAGEIATAQRLRAEVAEEAEALVLSLHVHLSGNRTRKLRDILRLDEDVASVTALGSYPQVGVRSFGGGLFPKGPVAGTETTYRGFNRLYRGALVLSQVKGWEGALAICPNELEGWFVSPEYRTFRCVPPEARPEYLAPLVRSEWFWGRLGSATRGVGARRERTRPEQFLDVEIPMPEVGDQELGARVFAETGALHGVCEATGPELDAFMPAVLDRAFKGEL